MTAAVSTVGNEVPRDLDENLIENKHHKPTSKSKKSKPKTGKETMDQIDAVEKKVKLGTKKPSKAASSRSKSNKRGRPMVDKKPSPRPEKATVTRKEDSSPGEKKKSTDNRTNNKAKRGKARRHAKRQIPLVPYSKPGVAITTGQIKYTLKRAESNRAHRQRVLSNRRKARKRTRTNKRKETQHGYLVEYWKEPEVKLDDLSSLDCGSYSDNVEVFEHELESTESPKAEVRKNAIMQDLLTMNTPPNFVFNISAPEFVPKRTKGKKQSNIFTMKELVASVKGKSLPRMPNLKKLYPGMCGL